MKTRRESADLGKDLTLSKSRMSEMDAATAFVRPRNVRIAYLEPDYSPPSLTPRSLIQGRVGCDTNGSQ